MADVFISYKREERAQVERIAERLRGLGLTVWFDARLPSGESFDEEINRELHDAKCVLVCWSPGAVQSQWVRAEAAIGRERDVLAAVMLSPTKLYPPFNLIHSTDLANWDGADLHPGWLAVIGRIGALADRPDLVERAGRYAAVSSASDDEASKRVTIEKRRSAKKKGGWGLRGAIAAATFVVLGVGGVFAFNYIQTATYRGAEYEIHFEGSAQGLQVGDTVRFNGVNVGEVTWLGLSAEDSTRAVARIEVIYDTPVRVDSVARVEPLGATGLMVLEITPGTMETSLLRDVDGAIRPRIRTTSADDVIPTENIWRRGEYWLDEPRSFDLQQGVEVDTGGNVSASADGQLLLNDGDWVVATAGPDGWPTYQACIDAIRATEAEATAPTYVDQTRPTACRRFQGTIVAAVHVHGIANDPGAGVEFRYVVWGGP